MGMTFNKGTFYPSEKKKKKDKKVTTKGNTVKEEKEFNETVKAVKPVLNKKEGVKKELAIMQLDDALGDRNLSNKSIKKVASAAADDKQLTKSLQKMERDLMRSGGRAGLKGGTFPGDFENFTKSREFKERKDKSHKGEVKAFKKYRERTATTRDEAKTQNMAKGGRAGYKSGTRGCKLAMKGKGRAYGKNS